MNTKLGEQYPVTKKKKKKKKKRKKKKKKKKKEREVNKELLLS